MLLTQRASEVCRGNRIQLKQLRASRWAWLKLVLQVFRLLQSRTDRQFQSWSRGITKPVGFYTWREVELAKYGFPDDCEECCVARVGAEAKPHSEGCRERIRQAMMNDDVGQQRLRAAEQRGSSAGEQPSVATRAPKRPRRAPMR